MRKGKRGIFFGKREEKRIGKKEVLEKGSEICREGEQTPHYQKKQRFLHCLRSAK